MSPEMQARLQEVELSWAVGLKTRAWQQGILRGGPAEQFHQWAQGDPGPEQGEQGFLDGPSSVEGPVLGRGAAARRR